MTQPTDQPNDESGDDKQAAIEALADAIESTGTASECPEGD
ncbi:hypothetical protein ABGB19_23425 [Mycobacterium sp. B14F4]